MRARAVARSSNRHIAQEISIAPMYSKVPCSFHWCDSIRNMPSIVTQQFAQAIDRSVS